MSLHEIALEEAFTFHNGKAPKSNPEGPFAIFGSNGRIGFSKEANHAGALVIGRVGAYCGSIEYSLEPFWASDNTIVVKPRENQNLRYWYYRLKLHPLGNYAGGAAQPLLTQGTLKPIKLLVHKNEDEQEQVAKILTTYDDLIENNRRRIQLLEESARLLYQEWFVHLRFPGYEQVKIIDGVPEGWESKSLTAIAEVNQTSLKKGFDERIEYIDISCVSTHSISDTTWYEFAEAPGRAKRIVKHCDILWSCVRPNRRSHVLVWEPHDRLIASTGFAVISATQVSPFFLYQSLTTNDYVGYLTNRAGGAAYPAVTAKVFEESLVLVPSLKLIEQYDDQVKDTYAQINMLQSQNAKLAQARDLLLPKLMSGELTV